LIFDEVTDKNKLAPFLRPMVYITLLSRYRVSTSTHWHFAFSTMLPQQQNQCIDCKSVQ